VWTLLSESCHLLSCFISYCLKSPLLPRQYQNPTHAWHSMQLANWQITETCVLHKLLPPCLTSLLCLNSPRSLRWRLCEKQLRQTWKQAAFISLHTCRLIPRFVVYLRIKYNLGLYLFLRGEVQELIWDISAGVSLLQKPMVRIYFLVLDCSESRLQRIVIFLSKRCLLF
jgi:hypothetical protein